MTSWKGTLLEMVAIMLLLIVLSSLGLAFYYHESYEAPFYGYDVAHFYFDDDGEYQGYWWEQTYNLPENVVLQYTIRPFPIVYNAVVGSGSEQNLRDYLLSEGGIVRRKHR